MEEKKIQWHPAFTAAMELELSESRDNLIFEKEYNLNSKPLELDLLVIKKENDTEIKNEIGKFFRKHNIMEYKSPRDSLDIDVLYKVLGYACLYKAYGKTLDAVKAEDVTVSLVRHTKPQKLFQYLKERDISYRKYADGIFYLKGLAFPVQIIITGEIGKKEHTWLRSLSEDMNTEEMTALVDAISKLEEPYDKELADSVFQVSIQANQKIMELLKESDIMCQALLEIMEPEIREIKVQSEARGIARGVISTLLDLDYSNEEIISTLRKKLKITKEQAEEYLAKYYENNTSL